MNPCCLLLITSCHPCGQRWPLKWSAPGTEVRLTASSPLRPPFWHFEDRYSICCLPLLRHHSWPPWAPKEDHEWPGYGAHQLYQHLWMHPIRAHGQVAVMFAWVFSSPVLLDQCNNTSFKHSFIPVFGVGYSCHWTLMQRRCAVNLPSLPRSPSIQ